MGKTKWKEGAIEMKNTRHIEKMFNLKREVAIVTGGSGKLGGEYVEILVHAGATVVNVDREIGKSEKIRTLLDAFPNRVSEYAMDTASKHRVVSGIEAIRNMIGTPTILVNNAGFHAPPTESTDATGPFETIPERAWDAVIDSHLKGAFFVSQEVVRHMREAGKGGSIINISSTYGLVAPDQSLYAHMRGGETDFWKPVYYTTAKAGMIGFTKWLAEYCGPHGIRVNALVPGGVYVGQDEQFVKEYSRRTILGRMAHPSDYNGAVLFLASPASAYMTGATLVVDGGWTAR